jgi:hypothetical protein
MSGPTPGLYRADGPFIVANDPNGNHPDIYLAEMVESDEEGRFVADIETRWANAKLMAASPDLLAFAQTVALGNTEYEELQRMAKALVAKAGV